MLPRSQNSDDEEHEKDGEDEDKDDNPVLRHQRSTQVARTRGRNVLQEGTSRRQAYYSIPISPSNTLKELKRGEEGSYSETPPEESIHHSHKIDAEVRAAKTVRT